MSNKQELELLVDIAKLLRKYGPEAFENLARDISSPEFSEHLASILATTAKTARTVRTKKRETGGRIGSSRDFRSSLVGLRETEPEKSMLLLNSHDGLMAKKCLPTLRDIQAFASDAGLPVLKATARDRAIIPFLKALLRLNLDDLRSRLSMIKPVLIKDDRSLEGWSNIILDKSRRTREGS